MAIPEWQLDSWANVGAQVTSAMAYTSVKNALAQHQWPHGQPTIYLQGSYGNSTNIRDSSDVDIVVELSEPFFSDQRLLSPTQIGALGFEPATYTFSDHAAAVGHALRAYYGAQGVERGSKAWKVVSAPASRGRPADVVPVLTHRLYTSPSSLIEGVGFNTVGVNPVSVVNYPRQHRKNGEAKNSAARTNGWFKPTVRIFKNMRDDAQSTAPSYFIECLVAVVPDEYFGTSYEDTCVNVINYTVLAPYLLPQKCPKSPQVAAYC